MARRLEKGLPSARQLWKRGSWCKRSKHSSTGYKPMASKRARRKPRRSCPGRAAGEARLAEAAEEAKRIVAQARADSETIRGRAETELKLAARDTVVRLQEALSRVLQAVLVDAVRGKLEDADFLGGLIRDVVQRYVEADAAGSGSIAVHVSEEMRQRLLSGTVAAFANDRGQANRPPRNPGRSGLCLRNRGRDGGSHRRFRVEVLSEMVGASWRKRVAAAAGLVVLKFFQSRVPWQTHFQLESDEDPSRITCQNCFIPAARRPARC